MEQTEPHATRSVVLYLVKDEGADEYSLEEADDGSAARPCLLRYLDEGGANVVFRILSMKTSDLPGPLQHRLLRLRKDVSHAAAAEVQVRALKENFGGMFRPQNVVQHDPIRLGSGVGSRLNKVLRGTARPSHRSSDWLPTQDTTGLLVTDMTASAGEVTLQLKPKWLSPSPSAPPGSKRCRTCALRAQRASRRVQTATDAQDLCPLDLVSDDVEERRDAIAALTTDTIIGEYLLGPAQGLLQQLRQCQMHLDPTGTLRASDAESVRRLCRAMTLRDCTLFVKRSVEGIEARLGDLDLKPEEKLSRWKDTEATLVDEGWYTNGESEENWVQEKTCLLSRSRESSRPRQTST